MKVSAKKLKDARFDNFHAELDGRWDYEQFVGGRHPDWCNDWISFDCLLADDRRDTIWCGLTSFAGDIFYASWTVRGTPMGTAIGASPTTGPAARMWIWSPIWYAVLRSWVI